LRQLLRCARHTGTQHIQAQRIFRGTADIQNHITIYEQPDFFHVYSLSLSRFVTEFACGTWIKETVIPANEAKVLKSWGATDKRVKQELRMIFEDQTPEPEATRLNEWYTACMDMHQVERFGLEDLKRVLAQVDAIVDADTLNAALVSLSLLNMQNLFALKVKMPAGEHEHYSLSVKPSGLTLASAAIYIQQDQESNQLLLGNLGRHFATLNELTGRSTHIAVCLKAS
jgi:predicted metalloendopeptidase